MNTAASPQEQEADRAAARRDFATARRLLEAAAKATPGRLETWLKLASMSNAAGDATVAMRCVDAALRLDARDFSALLMRASLLERAGLVDAAGLAFGEALANLPSAEQLSPAMQAGADKARQRYAAFQQALAARLRSLAINDAPSSAERRRVERFCSNVARLTRHYDAQPTHFHFPGLAELDFHDREEFPWLDAFESDIDTVEAELRTVLSAEAAEIVPYIQYPDSVPLDQWRALNRSRDWSAIHLLQKGKRVEANARHCPRLMELLASAPQPRIEGRSANAMFSLLAPRTHIPPHTGVSNARLLVHLPVIVPAHCRFRVGAESREWVRGKAWVFDDTIEHEAWNDSDELRIILIFVIWHPALTAFERDAVARIMPASGIVQGGL